MKKIGCSELGINDCNFVAKGETAGDVVKKVVGHLRAEHDIDIPDADVILAGEVGRDPLEIIDPSVTLVVERLTEALDIVPPTAHSRHQTRAYTRRLEGSILTRV